MVLNIGVPGSGEPENRRDMDWNSIDLSHVQHISTLRFSDTESQFSKKASPKSSTLLKINSSSHKRSEKSSSMLDRQSFDEADGYAHR